MKYQKKLIIIIGIVFVSIGTVYIFTTRLSRQEDQTSLQQDSRTSESDDIPQRPYVEGSFVKPSAEALRTSLTTLQYQVTQEESTEPRFANAYDTNTAPGLYVDIVSGEPLFSSKDKYDSGTGWPSFVKPISDDVVTEKEDEGFFGSRTEIRSSIADSHLGHLFDDGPKDRGGKRYCMNSAAMQFIPQADMEKLGYGKYVQFVE